MVYLQVKEEGRESDIAAGSSPESQRKCKIRLAGIELKAAARGPSILLCLFYSFFFLFRQAGGMRDEEFYFAVQ